MVGYASIVMKFIICIFIDRYAMRMGFRGVRLALRETIRGARIKVEVMEGEKSGAKLRLRRGSLIGRSTLLKGYVSIFIIFGIIQWLNTCLLRGPRLNTLVTIGLIYPDGEIFPELVCIANSPR